MTEISKEFHSSKCGCIYKRELIEVPLKVSKYSTGPKTRKIERLVIYTRCRTHQKKNKNRIN